MLTGNEGDTRWLCKRILVLVMVINLGALFHFHLLTHHTKLVMVITFTSFYHFDLLHGFITWNTLFVTLCLVAMVATSSPITQFCFTCVGLLVLQFGYWWSQNWSSWSIIICLHSVTCLNFHFIHTHSTDIISLPVSSHQNQCLFKKKTITINI